MPRTFFVVLAVQFISTVADNAFLIVAIARVVELSAAIWIIPILKLSFTVFYVVLAPFVGPLADAFPKGRVMLWSNLLKVFAVALLMMGIDPAVAYACAGLGAAIYAPAKYGLITELLPADELVRANGYFEGATVCAVIFGVVLGGVLVSPWMPGINLYAGMSYFSDTPTNLVAGTLSLLMLYVAATLLNFAVADNGVRYPGHANDPASLMRRFFNENRILWRDALGGLSLAVTTLLWGVAATLQLVVLRWASEALGLSLDQSAYLQGITALGVIAGAIFASRYIALVNATRVLPLGVLLGLLVPTLLLVHTVQWAAVLLIVVGALAGCFVVPMNALLQHRGCQLLTAGRSIAVQGFNENAGMLLMLGVYAIATVAGTSMQILVSGFGLLITISMLILIVAYRRVFRLQP